MQVVLRGGSYVLDAALEFGPEDSGTERLRSSIVAAGEKVVLSGGRRLEGGR